MTPEDQLDWDKFIEGLGFFSTLSADQIIEHWKLHKEDTFCDITHFSGQGSALCTRKGLDHLEELVRRRMKERANHKDFDLEDVLTEVSKLIGPSLRECAAKGESEDTAFEGVFNSASKAAEEKHAKSVYHFPCVLAGASCPGEFSLGPVRFRTAAVFETSLSTLSHDLISFDENVRNPEFISYIRQFGWIASVFIPSCSPKIAQGRAEIAARSAINIVRMWFGLGHGKRMRLVHSEPASTGDWTYLIESNNELSLCWSRTFEGAAVVNGWFDQVDAEHHKIASWLLRDIVFDEATDIQSRVVDALSWFGDAAFEPSPGAKIGKLTILLERLTCTTAKRFSKKRFCRRVAILAMENDTDFSAKFWEAYDFYNARSEITHGSSSQNSSEHWIALKRALPFIITSIFRAMEVYALIRFSKPGSVKSLNGFFDQQENRWSSQSKQLDLELVRRDAQRGFK